MKRIIIIGLVLLTGCSHVQPMASFELNAAIPYLSDELLSPERSYQCEQPQLRLEIGASTYNGWQAGVYHESMLLCGGNNDKPELYSNGVYVRKTWSGWRR